MKKRTDFEYKIQRRQLTPLDYYGYLQYEIKLDELRHLRCNKLISASTKELKHAFRNIKAQCLRHICYVFERALRRFPNEMTMWNDYLAFLKNQEAYTILNTVFGRVLSLHPTDENLWLQACIFELNHNNNAHSARVLFQRSLRFNKSSLKLWLHYYEMELWYVTRYIERNNVLTLSVDNIKELIHLPLVVFKHAMANLSDFNDLKQFHLSSVNIYDPIADIIMKKLEAAFHTDPAFWEYYLQCRLTEGLPLKPLCDLVKAPQCIDECTGFLLQFIADVTQYVPSYDIVRTVITFCDHILQYFTLVQPDTSLALSPFLVDRINQLIEYCTTAFPNSDLYFALMHLKLYQLTRMIDAVFPLSASFIACDFTPVTAVELLARSTDSADQTKWVLLADHALGALCNIRQIEPNADIDEQIVSLGSAVVNNCRVLSSNEGSELLQKCVPLLVQKVTTCELLEQLHKLVAHSSALVALRPFWYSMMVKLAVLDNISVNVPTIRMSSVYDWIEKHIESTPHDWHALDLSSYYSFVVERELMSAREGCTEAIADSRKLAAAAVSRCPAVDKFWEYSEEIERLGGNHAAANHIKWKKSNR